MEAAPALSRDAQQAAHDQCCEYEPLLNPARQRYNRRGASLNRVQRSSEEQPVPTITWNPAEFSVLMDMH